MYRILTYYNDLNNAPLLNGKIQETVHKFLDEESISDANNVTADIFSHTSNTQRENTNAIFTSEKIDTLGDLTETLNDLTINDTEYYVSNSATTNDVKVILHAIQRQLLTLVMGRERLRTLSTEKKLKY